MFKITNKTIGEIHETADKKLAMRIMRELLAEGATFSVEQTFAYRVETFNPESGETNYAFFDTLEEAERYSRWYNKNCEGNAEVKNNA